MGRRHRRSSTSSLCDSLAASSRVGELAPLVTAGGGLGVLAIVIVYLLANNRSDRGQAEERIDAAERRADEAEVRRQAAVQSEAAAWKAQREAEKRADLFENQITKLREEIAELSRKVEQLQETVT